MGHYNLKRQAEILPDGTIKIPLTKGKFAIVDAVDADLDKFRWVTRIGGSKKINYAGRDTNNRIRVTMHRIIMSRVLGRDLLSTEMIDHINTDGLDNRRCNLRLATGSQNRANQSIQRNNTSGYKGVTYRKDTGKWIAQTKINGKRVHIGCAFDTAEEAHEAYCKKMVELHGDFFRPK